MSRRSIGSTRFRISSKRHPISPSRISFEDAFRSVATASLRFIRRFAPHLSRCSRPPVECSSTLRVVVLLRSRSGPNSCLGVRRRAAHPVANGARITPCRPELLLLETSAFGAPAPSRCGVRPETKLVRVHWRRIRSARVPCPIQPPTRSTL